jgi:RecB family exonuclease
VIEVSFAIPVDGAMDSLVVKSTTTWLELQVAFAEKMVKSATKLNLAYKLSTDARNKALNRLANAVQFLEMMQEAREGLKKFLKAKSQGKNKASSFKVEIVDLDAGKDKEKAKGKGKAKKKVKFTDRIPRVCH